MCKALTGSEVKGLRYSPNKRDNALYRYLRMHGHPGSIVLGFVVVDPRWWRKSSCWSTGRAQPTRQSAYTPVRIIIVVSCKSLPFRGWSSAAANHQRVHRLLAILRHAFLQAWRQVLPADFGIQLACRRRREEMWASAENSEGWGETTHSNNNQQNVDDTYVQPQTVVVGL